jgi:hypothetical protein
MRETAWHFVPLMRPTQWPRAPVNGLLAGDRRRVPRGASGEPERAQLVSLVLGTFRETLGERLSLAEAERLFGLREATCRVVLDYLVAEKLLRRTRDGRYTMA